MAKKTKAFAPEQVKISKLTPHPRNYVVHPDDQIEHICESIREHGFYKNVVVAADYTILAGHGAVQAAEKMGMESVPVMRLDISPDDPKALKILAGDNEIAHLREIDDRALSEILKDIIDIDENGLLGTGYDPMMLANLVYVTRPASEIESFDEAAHWVGMPEFEIPPETIKVTISFRNEADRARCAELLGLEFSDKTRSAWFPRKPNDDVKSLRFEE